MDGSAGSIEVDPLLRRLTVCLLSGSSVNNMKSIWGDVKVSVTMEYFDTLGTKYRYSIPVVSSVIMLERDNDRNATQALFMVGRDLSRE